MLSQLNLKLSVVCTASRFNLNPTSRISQGPPSNLAPSLKPGGLELRWSLWDGRILIGIVVLCVLVN